MTPTATGTGKLTAQFLRDSFTRKGITLCGWNPGNRLLRTLVITDPRFRSKNSNFRRRNGEQQRGRCVLDNFVHYGLRDRVLGLLGGGVDMWLQERASGDDAGLTDRRLSAYDKVTYYTARTICSLGVRSCYSAHCNACVCVLIIPVIYSSTRSSRIRHSASGRELGRPPLHAAPPPCSRLIRAQLRLALAALRQLLLRELCMHPWRQRRILML
jgi:hypothetical protein